MGGEEGEKGDLEERGRDGLIYAYNVMYVDYPICALAM